MGFGSYDESEQQQQGSNENDDSEAVSVHEEDHDGQLTFESDESTNDLIDQLHDIKSDADE